MLTAKQILASARLEQQCPAKPFVIRERIVHFEIMSVCKGGGYTYCRTNPAHPKANAKGLYPLHRVLMENKLGRFLDPGEVVHHKDGDKYNDDLDNLELMTNAEHTKHHRPKLEKIQCVCPVCKEKFGVAPNLYRLRLKRSKRGVLTCSRECCGIRSRT